MSLNSDYIVEFCVWLAMNFWIEASISLNVNYEGRVWVAMYFLIEMLKSVSIIYEVELVSGGR